MSFFVDDRDHDHSKYNHGIDKEQMAENQSKIRVIISKFLQGNLNVFQLKQALNMLEKEELDLV